LANGFRFSGLSALVEEHIWINVLAVAYLGDLCQDVELLHFNAEWDDQRAPSVPAQIRIAREVIQQHIDSVYESGSALGIG
jgi:hypothetical protein